jgi:hypothetical protein
MMSKLLPPLTGDETYWNAKETFQTQGVDLVRDSSPCAGDFFYTVKPAGFADHGPLVQRIEGLTSAILAANDLYAKITGAPADLAEFHSAAAAMYNGATTALREKVQAAELSELLKLGRPNPYHRKRIKPAEQGLLGTEPEAGRLW